jgi:hypothetical protein
VAFSAADARSHPGSQWRCSLIPAMPRTQTTGAHKGQTSRLPTRRALVRTHPEPLFERQGGPSTAGAAKRAQRA